MEYNFKFYQEGHSHRHQFGFTEDSCGSYVGIQAVSVSEPYSGISSLRHIKDDKILWHPFDDGVFYLTEEVKSHIERLLRLKAFW
jgi:hypothetical protein